VWANYDVVKIKDGQADTVWLYASAPIPMSGIVGYSYNGTVLPDISTVYTDELKQTHPYAYVCYSDHVLNSLDGDYLWLTNRQLYAKKTGDRYILCTHGDVVSFKQYKCEDGLWVFKNENSISGSDQVHEPIWANADMYVMEHDGDAYMPTDTVALSASDPIPVYDKE
jgi:hypothetical protein